MRTKKAYEYREEAERILLTIVSDIPFTTHALTQEMRKQFEKISDVTVKRLLQNLWEKGKIKKIKIGRMVLWQK